MRILLRFIFKLFIYGSLLWTVVAVVALGNGFDPSYDYVFSAVRNAASQEEEALISLAESICPPYEDVAAVFVGDSPPESEECLWWYEDFDVRIPYALTADAIIYYEEFVRRREAELASILLYVSYEAHVLHDQPVPRMPGVQAEVVEMTLEYDSYCGRLCGEFFEKTRTV